MKIIWNDDDNQFGLADCLSTLAVWHEFKQQGEDYLDKVDLERLPYVVKTNIKGTTPDVVFDEFTGLFSGLVDDLSDYANQEDGFMQRVKEGSYTPIQDLLSTEIMTDAIGNVLIRKLTVVERMTNENAYIKALSIMDNVKVEMGAFLGLFITDAVGKVREACMRYGLNPKDVKAIKPRVTGLDWNGLVVAIRRDDKYIVVKGEEDDKQIGKSDETNPMYG